jgi:hypothetical protein
MDKYTAAKESATRPLTVVKTFLEAINKLDFQTARDCVSNDMQFLGVLGNVEGADEYFRQMEKMQLKYDVRKMFASDADVAVFYDITMGNEKVLAAGWYGFKHEKINRIQVVFDPRKVL